MLINYLKFYSEFKSLCNYKWYILNQSKVIYLIIYNEIVFIKYHIGYSDIDDLLLYELDKEDFKLFKKELTKKKNTVNIYINENYQLYLCDKTRLVEHSYFSATKINIVEHLKHINSNTQHSNYTNINPLFTINNIVLDSIDLGNFKGYQLQNDCLVNEDYINRIFKVLSLDEVIWSINKESQTLRISNLDGDLQIYLKLIVRYE